MVKDLTYLVNRYEYPIDVTTKEWLGDDYYYRTLVTNVGDAERFNYHSDYWGDAETYQEQNVDLMSNLESWVGERCKVDYGDGDCVEGTLVGILIDRQYNSVDHTCILFSDVVEEDERTAFLAGFNAGRKQAKNRKKVAVDLNTTVTFRNSFEAVVEAEVNLEEFITNHTEQFAFFFDEEPDEEQVFEAIENGDIDRDDIINAIIDFLESDVETASYVNATCGAEGEYVTWVDAGEIYDIWTEQ